MAQFSQRYLESMARDASLQPQAEREMWIETCEKMYHRNVAKIQMEFVEGKNQLLARKPQELVQVTFVNAEAGLPFMQAADDLADLQINEEIIHCIELLRNDMETAIAAHRKLLEQRKRSCKL